MSPVRNQPSFRAAAVGALGPVRVRRGQQHHPAATGTDDAYRLVELAEQVRVELRLPDVLVDAVELGVHQLPPVDQQDRHVRVVPGHRGLVSAGPAGAVVVEPVRRTQLLDVGQQGEAERLIAEGDKLAWLKNWQAAEPFFGKAEVLFRERGDKRDELYARISRMRGQLPSRGLFETSTYLASVLDDPLTKEALLAI